MVLPTCDKSLKHREIGHGAIDFIPLISQAPGRWLLYNAVSAFGNITPRNTVWTLDTASNRRFQNASKVYNYLLLNLVVMSNRSDRQQIFDVLLDSSIFHHRTFIRHSKDAVWESYSWG